MAAQPQQPGDIYLVFGLTFANPKFAMQFIFLKTHKKYSATPIAPMFTYMLNLILAWAFIPAAAIWA